MANTSFLLKNPGSKNETLIYLVVTFNRKRLKFSTKEKVLVKYWDKKKQRVKRVLNYPYIEINSRLNEIETEVFKIIESSKPLVYGILKEKIYNYLNDVTATPTNLLGFFEDFINKSKYRLNATTGKQLTKPTLYSYKRTYDLLKEYDKNIQKIDFDIIDLEFYEKFTSYIQTTYDFSGNTIGKHIKNLKIILNNAVERGINTNLTYRSKKFRIISEETDTVYLNETELKQIIDLDLSNNKRLEKARDLFILGCYTGLRYSDYSRLTKKNVLTSEGIKMFKIRTQKTNTDILIPILPQVENILNKYENLPKISNQKLNQYIKEVCELVPDLNKKTPHTSTQNGLRINKQIKKYKLISTHTARRSFATNMYNRGIPASTIMAITGHKTEKMFLTYIRATQKEKVINFVKALEQSNKFKIAINGK